ncbi:MAG: AMP-binding protein [Gemmatimonadetes bacterium]|nr:AMP-binding protein [Gemmatimonadota bacterium]
MTLISRFSATIDERANAPALEFRHADGTLLRWSFGDVAARAADAAERLRSRGLAPGDRCVVHLANSPLFIDLFLGAFAAGVILVPVNVLYRDRELGHIVADSDPALIVTAREHVGLFGTDARVVAAEDFLPPLGPVTRRSSAEPWASRAHLPDDDSVPAVIIYTSGTTGRAKGAVLSRANLLANAEHLTAAWRIGPDDRYLAVLPLFHVHGLGNGLCCWLLSGCAMHLIERFDAARAVAWFGAFKPTLFFGVPTVYVRLLDLPAESTREIGSGMRLFVCGSAALPAPVLEQFRERFGHTILERYGMSETLMNLGNPYDGERRAGSVGLPLGRVEYQIVDETAAPVPVGTVGQLEVRGPNVFAGYWRNDTATAAAFRGGWFRTGDMAECSDDGYVTLRGRASDLIISGGFNIYPREIEEFLLEQPGVGEVAVVGAPDRARGEVPIAYVVPGGALDHDALRAACGNALASFKVPRAFIEVASLPRTALGKIQRHLLPPWSPE